MTQAQSVLADLAASTQTAIVDVFGQRPGGPLKSTGLKRVVVAGALGPMPICVLNSMTYQRRTVWVRIRNCICAPTTAP